MSSPLPRWLLVPLLCACSQRSLPQEAVHKLADVGLELRARGPVAIEPEVHGAAITLRPGSRTPTRLSLLRELPGEPPGEPSASSLVGAVLPLAAPLQGRYSLTRSDGGSGGAEATLSGPIRSPTQRWTFVCHAQAESEHPEAECLALLATLRPTAAP